MLDIIELSSKSQEELVAIAKELNVRSGYSTDDPVLGQIYYGYAIIVDGAVTLDGADYGWYQITFDGRPAYVSAKFLSQTMPEGEDVPVVEEEKVQCEYCGEWFNAGNDYRNHVMAAHSDVIDNFTGADYGERTAEELMEDGIEIGD